MTSRQDGDLRRVAPNRAARLRGVVTADDRGVDVGELVDLGGTEGPDVDAVGLEPELEDLRDADHGVRGLGQDAVADGQRQPVRSAPIVPDS